MYEQDVKHRGGTLLKGLVGGDVFGHDCDRSGNLAYTA